MKTITSAELKELLKSTDFKPTGDHILTII